MNKFGINYATGRNVISGNISEDIRVVLFSFTKRFQTHKKA